MDWEVVGRWLAGSHGRAEEDRMRAEDVESKEMVDTVRRARRADLARMPGKGVKTDWEVDIRERSSVATSCLAGVRPGMAVWVGNHRDVSGDIL